MTFEVMYLEPALNNGAGSARGNARKCPAVVADSKTRQPKPI